MRKKHLWKRLGRTVLMLALTLCLVTLDMAPVLAVTQADIDKLKDEAADLSTQRKDLEKELDALADDKAEVLARRRKLDEQISTTSSQIQNVEAQISAYADLITQTEAELADALLAEYDVSRELATADVAKFVATIRAEGMLDD